jgi:hypothetical protein
LTACVLVVRTGDLFDKAKDFNLRQMRRFDRTFLVFLASAILGGTVMAATRADATSTWVRTVAGAACTVHPTDGAAGTTSGFGVIECPFPSDTINGVTSIHGNGVSTVYADYLLGEISGSLTSLSISACSAAYSSSAGSCGTTVNPGLALGSYDINVPVWSGTGSQWDYFYVTLMTNNPNGIILGGISATGAN